jgi:hypothetical protein
MCCWATLGRWTGGRGLRRSRVCSKTETMLKTCPRCRQSKPYTEEYFNRDRTRKWGLDVTCRSCNRAKCAAYAAKRQEPKRLGTLKDLGDMIVTSFLKLSPEEQERWRKEVFESMTGLPYRPQTAAELMVCGNCGAERATVFSPEDGYAAVCKRCREDYTRGNSPRKPYRPQERREWLN